MAQDFKPTNPDGSPMTPEQIDAARKKSEANQTANMLGSSDPNQGAAATSAFQANGGNQQVTANTGGTVTPTPVAVNKYSNPDGTTTDTPGGGPGGSAQGANPNTGITTGNTQGVAAGIGGFFGEKSDYPIFTSTRTADPNFDANRTLLASAREAVGNRADKTMVGARVATGPQDQTRGMQLDSAQRLQQLGAQRGPSAAEATLRSGTDAALRNSISLARSGRGNASVNLKAALGANADITQRVSNDAAALRASEEQAALGRQLTAEQAAAGVVSGARGQDLNLATTQSGLDQDTSKTNLTSAVDQQKQRDQLVQQYTAMGLSLDQANYNADLQQRQFNVGELNKAIAASTGVSTTNSVAGAKLAGDAIGAAAGAIGAIASDERAKTNITDGRAATEKFLSVLKPKGYEYKDPNRFGEGNHLGVMAQDVEKAAPGMIVEGPDGTKSLDMKKALSASLAALGDVNARLAKVEGKKPREMTVRANEKESATPEQIMAEQTPDENGLRADTLYMPRDRVKSSKALQPDTLYMDPLTVKTKATEESEAEALRRSAAASKSPKRKAS